jgi:hypothetical protein
MATSRLTIYTGACLLCGHRILSSLSEETEARYLLDEVWNDGGVDTCLEQAQWHFAMRSSQFDYDPSYTTDWGFQKAYVKPDDWIATSGVFSDEYLQQPLLQYADEAGFWYSDNEIIYVKYVSNDSNFGGDYSKWPGTFTEYVKAYFASRIIHKMPHSREDRIFLLGPPGQENRGHVNYSLMKAKNKSAMTRPTTFPQRGTWAQARRAGGYRGFRDGGNNSSLIG